jgi:hypothetical protein
MIERTCIECRWFDIDYEGDYSELTPGEGASITCLKFKWGMRNSDFNKDGTRRFRLAITMAEKCDEYSPEDPDATPQR